MRLIDADEITYERAHLIYPDGSECLGYRAVALSVVINSAPTVDAMEVVRCEDCKFFEADFSDDGVAFGRCVVDYPDIEFVERLGYDFCSYGERKGVFSDEM